MLCLLVATARAAPRAVGAWGGDINDTPSGDFERPPGKFFEICLPETLLMQFKSLSDVFL